MGSLPSSRRPESDFFWLHHLFGELVADSADRRNLKARELWAQVPRISGEYGARGPHFFVPYSDTIRPPPTEELRRVITTEWETPMWKLTNHEVRLETVGGDSCYQFILEETLKQSRANTT